MPAPDARLTAAQAEVRDVRRAALAKALVEARKSADMTQNQLADRSGLSRSAIARLEAGETSVSSDRLFDLAKALGVRLSDLIAAVEADPAAKKTL